MFSKGTGLPLRYDTIEEQGDYTNKKRLNRYNPVEPFL